MRELVEGAIEELCAAFAQHGYNPTPIIDLGVLVASADGRVTPKERELLGEVFQTLLETTLSADVVDHLVTASLEVIDAAGPESRARLVAEILHDCDAVEAGLLVAIAIAFASDGFTNKERTVIHRIAKAGRFPLEGLEPIVQRVREQAPNPASVREALKTSSARRGEATR